MIAAITAIGIIFWIFYYLFIKGNAWPYLLAVFAIFGGKILIIKYFPESSNKIASFLSYDISYATFIASIIVVLGIGVLMEKVK